MISLVFGGQPYMTDGPEQWLTKADGGETKEMVPLT